MPQKPLDDALDFLSLEAQRETLDSVYCWFHNLWTELEGNTPETDLEWFARRIGEGFEERHTNGTRWEQMTDEARAYYRTMALVVWQELPALQSRMAHRARSLSQAMKIAYQAEMQRRKKEA